MRRFGRSMLAFMLVVTALVMPGAAGAQQEMSMGCYVLANRSSLSTFTSLTFSLPFFAGETVSAVVGEPSLSAPQTVTLIANHGVVDTTPFPGTVSYTIPSDGEYLLVFRVDENTRGTFDTDCTPAEPPPPTIPTCNGLEATIYIKDGIIVGGPNNGVAYTGTLMGTSGSDVIVGIDAPDAIDAGAGNDTICGLGGNDTIEGAAGNDTMLGGPDADKLNGASGTDTTPDFSAAEGDKRTNVP